MTRRNGLCSECLCTLRYTTAHNVNGVHRNTDVRLCRRRIRTATRHAFKRGTQQTDMSSPNGENHTPMRERVQRTICLFIIYAKRI